ncbi:MAG: DNA polymerase III subunit epsilon [Alphaproteobacteria bacterium]|nr:DNA polymerase III subunit epsilon [Alphaproteobacteria bacterium]
MNELREIAFDTETTGLAWDKDDRIIELGAVELINHVPTGATFQTYINPGRPVSADTIRITGITDEHLKDKPGFEHPSIVDAFMDFIGDAILVAHNASFDRGFLNMELARCGRAPIPEHRWVDTVAIARKRYPGAPASLDALCKRFDVNAEARTFHGALLDSQLLSEVYLELLGGRARAFDFGDAETVEHAERAPARTRPSPLDVVIDAKEKAAHAAFVETLGDSALWKRYV